MVFRAASFGTFSQMTATMQRGNKSDSSKSLSAIELLIAGAVTGFVIAFIEVVLITWFFIMLF